MRTTFRLDTREFEAALKQYVIATGKDAAYCVNRQALNAAIKTGMRTPAASKASIRSLPKSKKWWPKFVAKRIMSSSGVRTRASKSNTGPNAKNRRYIRGGSGRGYTRQEARRASRQLIRNRENKAGYIRSGWLPAINRLSALKLSMRGRVNRTPRWARDSKAPGAVVPATPGIKPVATIINKAEGARPVAGRALQGGLLEAAADMRGYVAQKFGATAKRFNGKKRP